MSTDNYDDSGFPTKICELGQPIWILYLKRPGAPDMQEAFGEVVGFDSNGVLVRVDRPGDLGKVYLVSCEHWDERLSLCRRDLRRVGCVVGFSTNDITVALQH
jgi:hypothetical protein